MYCNKCGKQILNNAPYCNNCGNKINYFNNPVSSNTSKKKDKKQVITLIIVILVVIGLFSITFGEGMFSIGERAKSENIL